MPSRAWIVVSLVLTGPLVVLLRHDARGHAHARPGLDIRNLGLLGERHPFPSPMHAIDESIFFPARRYGAYSSWPCFFRSDLQQLVELDRPILYDDTPSLGERRFILEMYQLDDERFVTEYTIFDGDTGELVRTGLPAGGHGLGQNSAIGERRLALSVSELHGHGSDLNGDGDESDVVFHVFDLESRTAHNTGIAVLGPGYHIWEDHVVFSVHESYSGDVDGNGRKQSIVGMMRPGSTAIEYVVRGSGPTFFDRFLVFLRREAEFGDLNGDGDERDSFSFLYDAETGRVVDGAPLEWFYAVHRHGSKLLLSSSAALHLYDADADRWRSFPHPGAGGHGSGRWVALRVSEQSWNGDLNGDGDTIDTMGLALDMETEEILSLGAVNTFVNLNHGDLVRVVDGRAVFSGSEENDGVDHNGDGDLRDRPLTVYDFESRTFRRDYPEVWVFSVRDGLVACLLDELHPDHQDLNGDGDRSDLVLHVIDLASGLVHATGVSGAEGYVPAIAGRSVLWAVDEGNEGRTDFNGDGDWYDVVYHVLTLPR